jgi:hypothetical protein
MGRGKEPVTGSFSITVTPSSEDIEISTDEIYSFDALDV